MQLIIKHASLTLVATCALSCTNHVIADATPQLPVAQLACPTRVDANAPIVVDGSASEAPAGGFKSTTISIVPAGANAAADSLQATFSEREAGVATVKLVVTDKKGNTAEARCRVVVDEAGPSGEGEGSVGAGEGEGEGTVKPEVDLTGRFALIAYDNPQLSGGSLDPATQCGSAPMLAAVDIQQTGAHVSMSVTYCSVSLPNVQILGLGVQQTQIPVALTDALQRLSADFDLPSTSEGAAFSPPLDQLGVADIVGARMDDPDGPLPTDTNDPQVSDDDGDGWPGATIFASGNSEDVVYRRYVRAFDGTIENANLVDGTFRADGQASLLSNLFSFMVPTGSGMDSTFAMTRIDSDSSCDDVNAMAADLMSEFPAPTPPDGCPEF